MSGLSAEAEALLGDICTTVVTRPVTQRVLRHEFEVIEAAAHARGVAEERARWSVEALAKAIVASQTFAAHSAGCPVWRDRMKELDGVLVDLDTCTCLVKSDAPYTARRILAAMAPSSPSDARGGPEGSAGV